MRKWLARIGWALLILTLTVVVALASWEPFAAEPAAAALPAAAYRAEIARDEWGVPHIHGKRDVDVAFGIAWAHSEDDFSTLQDVLAMARGRYGAIKGAEGAQVDFVYHLLGARATAEREYPKLPADVRALVEAYCAGLNRYARLHPREIKLANLFPVDGRDIAAGFALRQPFFFGLDRVIGPLANGTPRDPEQGPPIAPSNPLGSDAALNGSNAFAIGPAKSADGSTMLVSNTHQPWRGPVAWYELTVESDEGWHFAGATFPGAPFPLLGHNEHLGWTNTVNRPDLVDVYELKLDKDGTHYLLDGKWVALEHKRALFGAKFGPLTIPVWRDIWRSVHGPVIVDGKKAFALRYGGMDRIGQIEEYFRLNKAHDYAEWRKALAMMAVPSTNFIYADEAGNIAYVYNAAIPDRPKGYDWRGTLPGDTSKAIWHGLVPFSALPQYFNPASGYLYNANNMPFAAAGTSDLSPDSVAPEMGVELTMGNRARRAGRLLAEAGPLSLAALERIKYDTGWERADYVARLLDGIAALDLSREPQLKAGQNLLARWDFNSDGKGPADSIANLVLKEATSADYNKRPPPDPRAQLEFAVKHLMDHFGRLDVPLTQLQRLRQGPDKRVIDLPMDGGSDTLRAATNWDIDPDGRLSVRHGDSFILFVTWPRNGPVSSTSIVPYGSATTRPDSPHYADQAPTFVRKQRKPVHFERADVLKSAVRRYVVTND
jgi:acyl-homoserine-lactone acylase